MEQMPKVVITTDADQSLEAMLKEVNEGFTSGRVKKTQLASWIIHHFRKKVFGKQIEKIRADHFDQIAHLKAVIKQIEEAKRTDANFELDKLLSPLNSGAPKARKPTPAKTDEK
jgi:hypothetical protein